MLVFIPQTAANTTTLKTRLKTAIKRRKSDVRARSFDGARIRVSLRILGLLHMEIIEERLEREFDLDLVTTAPSVNYKVKLTNGEELTVSNPTHLPAPDRIEYMEEPVVKAEIYTPPEYVGAIMELCQDKRGVYKELAYLDSSRSKLVYEIPLNEIIYDFFDALNRARAATQVWIMK